MHGNERTYVEWQALKMHPMLSMGKPQSIPNEQLVKGYFLMSEPAVWKPAPSPLFTRWTVDVNPELPLPEYPRPQMTRPDWMNLNGLRDYVVQPDVALQPDYYTGKILVPFPLESSLSGVGRPLQPDEKLWYQRIFTLPSNWQDQRIILHFGAVDWHADVWLNGCFIGSHTGGYLPFSFELTPFIHYFNPNQLVISVQDPTDIGLQARGKQSLHPKAIWYTAISGIWQTVWLEPVPDASIRSLKMTPDIDTGQLHCMVDLDGPEQEKILIEVTAMDNEEEVARSYASAGRLISLFIPNPKLWCPETPHLYQLRVRLLKNGNPLDEVGSYFAMRSYRLRSDAHGYPRFELNHQPIFLYGTLDQGYFPDGLYTCLLYTSPSPRDRTRSRMPSSA